jgi:hypothetical protein
VVTTLTNRREDVAEQRIGADLLPWECGNQHLADLVRQVFLRAS